MKDSSVKETVNNIINEIGQNSPVIKKEFYFGNPSMEAVIIYVNGLVDKNLIDSDVLKPLMLYCNENLNKVQELEDYIVKKYITVSNSYIENDINKVIALLRRGKSVLIISNQCKFVILDTSQSEGRDVVEPVNESTVRGPREGFVEKLETNISLLRKRVKDKNLKIEKVVVGRRSQTDVAILYIDDIMDKKILENIKERINKIDIDILSASGELEQYIEEYPYTIFPQTFASERPDVIAVNMLEGRAAIIVDGTPFVITIPTMFNEFITAPEDYYERTVIGSLGRLLRYIAIFIIMTMPSAYLVFMNFNSELVPIDYINPTIESRKGVALSPFLEILAMLLAIEFLREGGLRLPSRIGQTLSVVGGIIIGEAAIRAKAVSPGTLLIVGITVVATFVITNYQMALAIRFLGYPMLILTNVLGMLGIAGFWFFIIVHLCSLESFGVDYIDLNKQDKKDLLIRAPLWKMNKRPRRIPNNDGTRQTDFRKTFRRKKQ